MGSLLQTIIKCNSLSIVEANMMIENVYYITYEFVGFKSISQSVLDVIVLCSDQIQRHIKSSKKRIKQKSDEKKYATNSSFKSSEKTIQNTQKRDSPIFT